ncbi:MAG: hypothetical protein WCQ95_08415 [Bacteroidota bacterium]
MSKILTKQSIAINTQLIFQHYFVSNKKEEKLIPIEIKVVISLNYYFL